jgi:hypothetical protein
VGRKVDRSGEKITSRSYGQMDLAPRRWYRGRCIWRKDCPASLLLIGEHLSPNEYQ